MKKLKVYLVDDEQLALRRLRRLILETEMVEISGETTKPLEALQEIPTLQLDAIFLDIQMPDLSGFELLKKMEVYPPVVFTTAFDRFALQAFEVFSVDYLLKPVERERLELTLRKLSRFRGGNNAEAISNIEDLIRNLARETGEQEKLPIPRIASRIGGRIQLLDITEVTHFIAEDKLTFAQTVDGRRFPVDGSLNELEARLGGQDFLRIHRGAIINVGLIDEVHGWFSGRVLVRLRDKMKTELIVARERVKALKSRIGI